MRLYKRLRIRFACFCAISTGCVVTVLAICNYIYSVRQIEYRAEQDFLNDCHAILHSLDAREAVTPELLGQMEANHNLLIELDSHQPDSESTPERNVFLTESEEGEFRVCVASLSIGEEWVGATIVRNRSHEYGQCARLRLFVGSGIAAVIGMLAAASWVYSSWAIRPIAEEFHKRTEFLSSVSHELRSPLTVIRMNAQNIPKAPADEAGKLVHTIVAETNRLNRVIKDMMDLTNILRNGWSICVSQQNPSYILLLAFESFELAAKEKGISLRVVTPEYTLPKVDCDLDRMQQVLAVFINNAMRYTPVGGQITLQVEQQRKHIAFIVSDSGTGIPDSIKGKVFEKFYRGKAAGTNHDHYGLGLNIAMEYVLLHHGELLVEDSPLGGARFIARIPLVAPKVKSSAHHKPNGKEKSC